MEQRVTVITLGVADLQRARRFYEKGLGWSASLAGDKDVAFFQANGIVIALWIRDLLAKDLVMPSKLEIMIMRADGTDKRQLTSNGAANFAPYFHPNGRQIIFASNVNNKDPRSPNFDLFLINRDGTGLQQVTFDEGFDGFPMFSPDGRRLVWASNRNGAREGDTNVFIAEWAD